MDPGEGDRGRGRVGHDRRVPCVRQLSWTVIRGMSVLGQRREVGCLVRIIIVRM